MKKKKVIPINELKVGMVTAGEIIFDDKVLMGEGVRVTEQIINKLKYQFFLSEIEVYYEVEISKENVGNGKIKTTEEIDKSFKQLSFSVGKIFENMQNLQPSGIEEVRKFALIIQAELESTSAVIKNIVLYGSGNDSIYRHSVNVAALSSILGSWLDFNESQIKLLTYSAILHDFGKTKINKSIIDKAGPLSEKEFNIIKNHPKIGYDYVKEVPFLDKAVSYGVLMHHERMDGSGYPLGLKGEKIHPFAKIIAIADIFDAVNSDRVHKKSKGPFEALEVVQKESLGRLDYEYCKVFLSHVVNYYMGENVQLNTNKICKIIQVDTNDLGRPLILDDTNFIDLKKQKDLYIERLVL